MTNGKKDILIIMGRYLPGYKDGGPVRSIQNLVDYLGDEYNFMILTCDRDHGDTEPYSNIKKDDYNQVGKAKVYYVPPKGFTFSLIRKLASEADLVYCCGCFNDYAIKSLILNRLGLLKKTLIVAAMGLFSPGEFKLKYRKKKLFIIVFNILGLFKNIYWSATSEMEINEIKNQIKTNNNFFIAEDLPRRVEYSSFFKNKHKGKLDVVWISRIAPKKNLKGAIHILQHVRNEINLTIYGPIHVEAYWEECLVELKKLPKNVNWEYSGNVDSEVVVKTLSKHQLFLFPTLGENYGHVIQEALSAGCVTIVSDQTPWKDLEKNSVGNVYPINKVNEFVSAIEFYAEMDQTGFQKISDLAVTYAIDNSKDKVKESGYQQIFRSKKVTI
ncbi:glycosyltransferase family 4 protein [Paenibacillus sp. YAF4_2]|uniref:glycosyltransferase family 4 protein n=1 Tax=Paenibacillus sp. YAF4_2 TaxID=3233085 RepID=UPI003F98B0FC